MSQLTDKVFMEDMADIYAYLDGCERHTLTVFEKFAMLGDILRWYDLEPTDIEAEEGVIYIANFPDGGMDRDHAEIIIKLGFDFDDIWKMIVLYT